MGGRGSFLQLHYLTSKAPIGCLRCVSVSQTRVVAAVDGARAKLLDRGCSEVWAKELGLDTCSTGQLAEGQRRVTASRPLVRPCRHRSRPGGLLAAGSSGAGWARSQGSNTWL